MADIVAFPTDTAAEAERVDRMAEDSFLLDEGLELLADFRTIADSDVRDSLRALIKSMSRSSARLSS